MKLRENKAEWPQNLVLYIFGRDNLEGCRVAEDWRGSLEYILMERIPDDEELAVRYRYQEGLTYRELGERLGIEIEKAKRKVHRGIRRLRHPRCARYLHHGVDAVYTKEWEWIREARFNEGYWIGFQHGSLGDMAPQLLNPYREHDDPSKMPIMDAPIEYLELSTRMHGALSRATIQTVGQVLTKSRKELLQIRNVGKGSVDELEAKLMQYHLSLPR